MWQDGQHWDASPLSAAAKRRVLRFGAALGRAFSAAAPEAAPEAQEGTVAIGSMVGRGSAPATDAADAAEVAAVRGAADGSLDEDAGPSAAAAAAEPAAARGTVGARVNGGAAAGETAPAPMGPQQAWPFSFLAPAPLSLVLAHAISIYG